MAAAITPALTADQALARARASKERLTACVEEVDRVHEATTRLTKANHFVEMFEAVLAGR